MKDNCLHPQQLSKSEATTAEFQHVQQLQVKPRGQGQIQDDKPRSRRSHGGGGATEVEEPWRRRGHGRGGATNEEESRRSLMTADLLLSHDPAVVLMVVVGSSWTDAVS